CARGGYFYYFDFW
nr:immunoglobulin heavy chain junction region [Mus musculus]MBK4198800.1 immunoglobulin heavy chain junction region [Mus musculus]